MKTDLLELKQLKEKLFRIRMLKAKENKTLPWSKDQVIKVLKNLKKGKSRDHLGLAN